MIKEYQFWGQYKVPALTAYWVYMDGVYIDGDLFENNVPVRDGTIHLSASPQSADLAIKSLEVHAPTYQNGQVDSIGHIFSWPLNAVATLSADLDYNGHPYGMGLNVLYVYLAVLPPITHNVWINVLWQFSLEVG